MANYWGTDITLSADNKKIDLAAIAKELQEHLDPSESHTILGDADVYYQTKWDFHDISYEVQEFSERHPEVIFHYYNHGDVPYMYDHGDELHEQNHINEYIQNGSYIQRASFTYTQLLEILTAADLKKVAGKYKVALPSKAKKSDIVSTLVESWKANEDFWFNWDHLTAAMIKRICAKKSLSQTGTKQELRARIEKVYNVGFAVVEPEFEKWSLEHFDKMRAEFDDDELFEDGAKWLYSVIGRRGNVSAEGLRTAVNILFETGSRVVNFEDPRSDFYKGFFDHLHPAIYKIESLVRLAVNRIELHEELGQLKNLRLLNVVGTGPLPKSICELTNLETIGLAGFDWEDDDAYDSWSNMKELHTFQMSEMGMTKLPASLADCPNLKQLNMRDNAITEIPEAFSRLTKLEGFHMRNNKLTTLPDWIGSFEHLEHLHVDGNEIPQEEIDAFKAKYPHIEVHDTAPKPNNGCFLTTAACEHRGLADDCRELQTLRHMRDSWMSAEFPEDIEAYYSIAPKIVEAVNARSDASNIWEAVFVDCIQPCVELCEGLQYGKAHTMYKSFTNALSHQLNIDA